MDKEDSRKGGPHVQELHIRIQELKDQLLGLGYHSFQINSIIKETIGKNDDNMNATQAASLIKALEDYLHFAVKCKANK